MSARFDLYCDGCGKWITFMPSDDCPTCPTCRTSRWLDDNEPRGRVPELADYYEPDTVSDADPGL